MPENKPNIILIITDNQSASMLACSGNAEVSTPHLDRLAGQGTRFENAFCPNAMCSPCRASIFTGQMPSHHGVHTWIDDRLQPQWPDNWNAVGSYQTLPRILKNVGYTTALIGKYHLGKPDVADAGIDHWVTMERGHTLDFHGNVMSVNGATFVHEGHSVEFFTDQAVEYLNERSKQPDQPFALILAYNGPYGHWPAIKGVPDNPFFEQYADCPMHSVPREGLSPQTIALYERQKHNSGNGGPDFSALLQIPNNLTSLRNYYSQMSLIDNCVGRVLAAADKQRLSGKTDIIFTADHGFSLGHHGFWGHGQATWPSNTFRAAFNVPLLIKRGQQNVSGQVRPELVSTVDLFATVVEAAGQPALHGPSRSLLPLLENGTSVSWDNTVFHEQEETRSIRTSRYLFVKRFQCADYPELIDELYDLNADPDERNNLSGSPDHQSVCADLNRRLEDFFSKHASPEFDLWNGGTVKSNTSRGWLWRTVYGENWAPIFNSS